MQVVIATSKANPRAHCRAPLFRSGPLEEHQGSGTQPHPSFFSCSMTARPDLIPSLRTNRLTVQDPGFGLSAYWGFDTRSICPNLAYNAMLRPICYTMISKVSSTRLGQKIADLARAGYRATNIVCENILYLEHCGAELRTGKHMIMVWVVFVLHRLLCIHGCQRRAIEVMRS